MLWIWKFGKFKFLFVMNVGDNLENNILLENYFNFLNKNVKMFDLEKEGGKNILFITMI